MSYTYTYSGVQSGAAITRPVWLPPMRAGEIDGRFIDATQDLGMINDYVPGLAALTVSITREDGTALDPINDLQSAGGAWPDQLDPTGLIITLGLNAPSGAAGQTYWITITVDTTAQGRIWIRDLIMTVAAQMG
jgi:hypothetical protein